MRSHIVHGGRTSADGSSHLTLSRSWLTCVSLLDQQAWISSAILICGGEVDGCGKRVGREAGWRL